MNFKKDINCLHCNKSLLGYVTYQCYDCDGKMHKECLIQHCKDSRQFPFLPDKQYSHLTQEQRKENILNWIKHLEIEDKELLDDIIKQNWNNIYNANNYNNILNALKSFVTYAETLEAPFPNAIYPVYKQAKDVLKQVEENQ